MNPQRSLDYISHCREKFNISLTEGRWDDAAHYAHAMSNEWVNLAKECQEHYIRTLAGGKGDRAR
jgi:hypothetical protein